jgi:hypothetical protein
MIVGAVGIVLVLAAADAIRPTTEEPASKPTAKTAFPELPGVVVVGSNCRSLKAIQMKRVSEVQIPRQTDCDGLVWSDDGTLYANCIDRRTTIGTSDGHRMDVVPGCAPAWRPDGALSVIHNGDVLISRRHGRQRPFLSREQLAEALAGALEGGRTYGLVDIAWHGTAAFFGIAAGRERWQRAVIAYTPEGVTGIFPELGQNISRVRVSPNGTYIAFTRSEAGREIVVLDGSGQEVRSPRIANALGIAWSPDEQWVAVSTRTTTFIARAGSSKVVSQLPEGGEWLAWLQ